MKECLNSMNKLCEFYFFLKYFFLITYVKRLWIKYFKKINLYLTQTYFITIYNYLPDLEITKKTLR